MLKQLLVCYIAIQLTAQACNKGCLSCNADNQCTLCDLSNNYYLDNTTKACKLAALENCVSYNTNGQCTACNSTNFLQGDKCVAVTQETMTALPNCQVWSSNGTACQSCKPDYLLEQTKCVQVTTKLANCETHLTQLTCGDCNSGYLLSTDKKSCTALPTSANCWNYGDHTCDVCDVNFVVNQNLYRTAYVPTANLSTLVGTNLDEDVDYMNVAVCQAVTDKNCMTFTDFKTCSECKTGYYLLQNKTCQINPVNVRTNCEVYSTNSKCTRCAANFYPKSSGACVAVTVVPNCAEYETSLVTKAGQCKRCDATHYLLSNSSPTACQTRTKASITGCATLSTSRDNCETCSNNFVGEPVGVSGYDSCISSVTNCSVYSVLTVTIDNQSQKRSSCTTCAAGYYRAISSVNNNLVDCQPGNDDKNCQVFLQTTTYASAEAAVCSLCKNNYYLNGSNACTENTQVVQNCNRYANKSANKCDVCNANFFATTISLDCLTDLTVIQNCKTYTGDAANRKCATCNDGFYLTGTGSSCTTLNTVPNCTGANDNNTPLECTTCAAGYSRARLVEQTLATDYKCRTLPGSLTDKCDSNSTSGNLWSKAACSQCNSSSVPMDLTGHSVCVSRQNLEILTGHDAYNAQTANNGCAVYDAAGDCIQCVSGMGLDTTTVNHVCVQLTHANCAKRILLTRTSNTVMQTNICNGTTPVAYLATNQVGADQIVKCNAPTDFTKVSATPGLINYTNVDISNVQNDVTVNHWQTMNPQVACEVQTGKNFIPATFSSNCEYYAQKTGTTYFCLKCVSGKTSSSEDNQQQCSVTQTCQNQVRGVPLDWAVRLSCTQCSTGQIPYYAADVTKVDESMFKAFLATDPKWSGAGAKSQVQGCIGESQQELRTATSMNNLVLKTTAIDYTVAGEVPANCGLLVMNLGTTIAVNNTAIVKSLGCAYCKKGYKASGTAVAFGTIEMVVHCEKIDNCSESNQMVNGCEECQNDYGLPFTLSSGAIDTTQCTKNVNENVVANCLTYQAGNCVFCKKGYSKSLDNTCQRLTPARCAQADFVVQDLNLNTTPVTGGGASQAAESSFKNRLLRTYLTPQVLGCSQCSDSNGMVGVLTQNAIGTEGAFQNQYCVQSDMAHGTFPTNTNYVPNCDKYSTGNYTTLQCNVCKSGYTLTADAKCVANSVVPNCKVYTAKTAQTADQNCQTCNDGYGIVVNGAKHTCLVLSDANCAAAVTSGNTTTTVACSQCKPDYYLDSSVSPARCKLGYVRNCLKMGDANTCNECNTGYKKTSGLNNLVQGQPNSTAVSITRNYCVKVPTNLGCASYENLTPVANILQWKCATCTTPQNVPTAPKTTNFTSSCTPFNPITNCVKYNVDEQLHTTNTHANAAHHQSLASSNFQCLQCADGFYVDVGSSTASGPLGLDCKERVATKDNQNCAVFENFEDKCQTCNEGYFLSTNKLECVVYPSGEDGCTSWKTDAKNNRLCNSCNTAEYYMENGTCKLPVEKDSNCAKVKNSTSCEVCNAGHLLTNGPATDSSKLTNHCKAGTNMTNCSLLSALDSCQTCANGYKIKVNTTNQKQTCQSVSISGCASVAQGGYSGDKCVSCTGARFLTDNGATCKSTSTISKCAMYTGDKICGKCEKGFSLAVNKDACTAVVSGFDSNCMHASTGAAKVCSKCGPGYQFNAEGVCVALTGVQSKSEGCLVGDYSDVNKCLVCRPSHYMNSSQKCVSNTPPTQPPTENAGIKGALFAVLALLMIL